MLTICKSISWKVVLTNSNDYPVFHCLCLGAECTILWQYTLVTSWFKYKWLQPFRFCLLLNMGGFFPFLSSLFFCHSLCITKFCFPAGTEIPDCSMFCKSCSSILLRFYQAELESVATNQLYWWSCQGRHECFSHDSRDLPWRAVVRYIMKNVD